MNNIHPLVKKNLKHISDQVTKSYDNQILEQVNNHCLRMSVMEESYRWHFHQYTDELFIILEGALKIETRDGTVFLLQPGDFITIPQP